jgi:hypothetical protein
LTAGEIKGKIVPTDAAKVRIRIVDIMIPDVTFMEYHER